ncbi:MAG: polyprenyl diphosphate synthase, partial [Dehalococcoidales bacterium]|nr:polyprenyl diphosphate synthase [Dehalococcoidales bacterium]
FMGPATIDLKQLPHHVAIVPDGNGRWAQERGLPRVAGHRAGILNMLKLVQYINEYPIKYLTFYGFSTENWTRPEMEVSGLFGVVQKFVDDHLEDIHHANIKIIHIGRKQGLPDYLANAIEKAVARTANNSGMVLNVAWNYGGRAEIVDAVNRILKQNPEKTIDETNFANYLYTAGSPDVDLLIRTGDVTRLSNFLIWQTAYAEYYFSKILWPDFDKAEIEKALVAYSQRERRFGGLKT